MHTDCGLSLDGMYLMTNSQNCTCQQSSVNCQDQRVCMKGSIAAFARSKATMELYLETEFRPIQYWHPSHLPW